MKTIAVCGFFGDKKVNREEFIAQWVGHVGELRGLSFNQDFAEKIENFEIDVRREAGREFDRLYNQQHPA